MDSLLYSTFSARHLRNWLYFRVSALSKASPTTNQHVLECCWDCTQEPGWLLSKPQLQIYGGRQHIVCGSCDETSPIRLHSETVFALKTLHPDEQNQAFWEDEKYFFSVIKQKTSNTIVYAHVDHSLCGSQN